MQRLKYISLNKIVSEQIFGESDTYQLSPLNARYSHEKQVGRNPAYIII